MGCEGGLAYWTSFHGNDWDVPTDRLAAQRRAEQDIELLNLLAKQEGWSARRVARAVAVPRAR